MKVDAQQLWQAVKNATLFTRERTSDGKTLNGGEAMFQIQPGRVDVVGALNFISVMTSVATDTTDREKIFIPAKDLKELERELREREGELELDLSMGTEDAHDPEFWDELGKVSYSIGAHPAKVSAFETNPELLTQMGRLEPKGEYPLSWMGFRHEGDLCVAFRYGPRTYGILVPLDREALVEAGHGDHLWKP
jgi:hypothetical protein